METSNLFRLYLANNPNIYSVGSELEEATLVGAQDKQTRVKCR
jgi:hypothetical protein